MNKEKWREIPGYDGDYEVSNLGRVRSYKRRKPTILSGGVKTYVHVALSNKKRERSYYSVAGLVAEEFIHERQEGMEINHIDGNKLNNSVCNLEYVTPSENVLHAFRTGLRKSVHGEKNGNATLSESDAREIKNVAGIEKQTVTARRHGVSQAHISRIQSGKCWSWLKDE